jgi:hypothetical protein
VVRLVDSALHVFASHLDDHVRAIPCAATTTARRWVAVPALEHESDLVWE